MPNILAFGDSNTHGTMPLQHMGDKRRHPIGVRWPTVMAADLGADFHVIEEGHPGRTTVHDDPTIGEHRNGARVLPSLLESHCPLDLVIIMLGTNDLKGMFSADALDIANGVARLMRIINGAECGVDGGSPEILIVSPAPVLETGFFAEMRPGGRDKSIRAAVTLRDLATRTGAHFFDAANVATVDAAEGVHLDADTHIALGHAMAVEVGRIFSA